MIYNHRYDQFFLEKMRENVRRSLKKQNLSCIHEYREFENDTLPCHKKGRTNMSSFIIERYFCRCKKSGYVFSFREPFSAAGGCEMMDN